MTTIIYDHKNKQIACDGRIQQDRKILSEQFQKWHQVGDEIYFFSGCVADIKEFIKYPRDFGSKPPGSIKVSCFRVSGGKVFECGVDDETGYFETECQYSAGHGSGEDFALAALDFGNSAKDAVEYAKTRDSGTGGKVSVYDITSARFID